MHRESEEEVGYNGLWTRYGEMGDAKTWRVALFYSVMSPGQMPPAGLEDQEVIPVPVSDIGRRYWEMVSHTPMSIMAALARRNGERFFLSAHFPGPEEAKQ